MASSGGYAGQCRDARRRGRELRGGVRGQVHAALSLLIEAVRTLDTRAHRTPGPSSPQAPSPDCDYGLSAPLTVMTERPRPPTSLWSQQRLPFKRESPKRRKISGKICERATSTNRARTGDLSPVILERDRVSAGSLGAFRGRLSNRQYCYDRRLSISALSAASIVRYEASAAITRDRVSAMQPVSPTPSISAHRSASS